MIRLHDIYTERKRDIESADEQKKAEDAFKHMLQKKNPPISLFFDQFRWISIDFIFRQCQNSVFRSTLKIPNTLQQKIQKFVVAVIDDHAPDSSKAISYLKSIGVEDDRFWYFTRDKKTIPKGFNVRSEFSMDTKNNAICVSTDAPKKNADSEPDKKRAKKAKNSDKESKKDEILLADYAASFFPENSHVITVSTRLTDITVHTSTGSRKIKKNEIHDIVKFCVPHMVHRGARMWGPSMGHLGDCTPHAQGLNFKCGAISRVLFGIITKKRIGTRVRPKQWPVADLDRAIRHFKSDKAILRLPMITCNTISDTEKMDGFADDKNAAKKFEKNENRRDYI